MRTMRLARRQSCPKQPTPQHAQRAPATDSRWMTRTSLDCPMRCELRVGQGVGRRLSQLLGQRLGDWFTTEHETAERIAS